MILKKLFSKNPKKPRKTKSLQKSLRKIKKQDLIAIASESFELANQRIKSLVESGLSDFSRALINFREESGHKYFGESNKRNPTKFEILNELYAARNFLSDITSTKEGVIKEIAIIKSSEALPDLGYRKEYGTHHNPYKIDADTAKLAYGIYRRLEQFDKSLIYGKAGYGSDVTIALSFSIAAEQAIEYSQLNDNEKDLAIDRGLEDVMNYINANARAKDPYSIRNYTTDYNNINNLIKNIRRGRLTS